jgi:Flp pilus assembly protein TadG
MLRYDRDEAGQGFLSLHGLTLQMSILRTLIVVGAVIALLPSDRAQQERIAQAAVDAAQWTMTFCDRNAQTCENASAAWAVFKAKAEFAVGVAYDVASTHMLKAAGTVESGPPPAETSALSSRGTLNARDLEPAWRGNAER